MRLTESIKARILMIKESISARMENQARRKQLIESFDGLGIDASDFPSPVDLIREDRDR